MKTVITCAVLYVLIGIASGADHANRHGCVAGKPKATCSLVAIAVLAWPLYWTTWGALIVTEELRKTETKP